MKNLEKYLLLGLVGLLGFIIYLGMNVYDRSLVPGTDIEQLPTVTRPESTGLQYETEKIENRDIFLVAYQNDSISRIRNLFKSRIFQVQKEKNAQGGTSIAQPTEEKVITVEKPKTSVIPQSKEAEKEEPLPNVTMKGIVLSENKQALILDIEGKIQILTSDKPLPSGFSLVRITKNEAILSYKGREITLKF